MVLRMPARAGAAAAALLMVMRLQTASAATALGAATTPTCAWAAGAQGPAEMVVVHPPQSDPYYSFERCEY